MEGMEGKMMNADGSIRPMTEQEKKEAKDFLMGKLNEALDEVNEIKKETEESGVKISTRVTDDYNALYLPFEKISDEEMEKRSGIIDNLSDVEKEWLKEDDVIREKFSDLFGGVMDTIIPNAKKMKVPYNKRHIFIPVDTIQKVIPIEDFIPEKTSRGDYIVINKKEFKIDPKVQADYDSGKLPKGIYDIIVDSAEKDGYDMTYVGFDEESQSTFIERVFGEMVKKISDNKKLFINTMSEQEQRELYVKLKEKFDNK